jgi:hypothetical protein
MFGFAIMAGFPNGVFQWRLKDKDRTVDRRFSAGDGYHPKLPRARNSLHAPWMDASDMEGV